MATFQQYVGSTNALGTLLRSKVPEVLRLVATGKMSAAEKALWNTTVTKHFAREVQLWRFLNARQIRTKDGALVPAPTEIPCIQGVQPACNRLTLEKNITSLPALVVSSAQQKKGLGDAGGTGGQPSTAKPARWQEAKVWSGGTATDVEVVPGAQFFGLEEHFGLDDLGVVPLIIAALPWAFGLAVAMTAVVAAAKMSPQVVQAFNGEKLRADCINKIIDLKSKGAPVPPELSKCAKETSGGLFGSVKTIAIIGAAIAAFMYAQKRGIIPTRTGAPRGVAGLGDACPPGKRLVRIGQRSFCTTLAGYY